MFLALHMGKVPRYNGPSIQNHNIIRDSGMRSVVRLLLLSTVIAFTGCATQQEEAEVLAEQTYYENARQAMNSGNFNQAEENLDALETYYPFGRYAEQAQLDLIYARFQNMDLEGSRAAADRFMRLNPQSEQLDYAMYMRGLASYNLDLGLAAKYLPIDVAARNPGEQLQAFRDFSRLLDRFPDSEYAPDARQRMIAVRNRMADLELHAARYYIKREAYLAANNRARYVVENYPSAPAVEDALILMTDTYRMLELDDAAEDSLATLRKNFPDSDVFADNGDYQSEAIQRQDRSLLNVVTFGLLGED
ncbi:Beta-barrel assembly machine subunit BamD [Marinobacter persicus]|uniref:Outer membrane protein assembly factor BamD n=2 Tax=Marinobacter persicus TaxID=930118 RepID=A0A1I3X232_9GAMM|nr:outer membrane protein assembly factor BamD [Marinobacter persicus]SFK13862.1 Beta-barrel assembly machine subunit BamD [Marinobacter persicus]